MKPMRLSAALALTLLAAGAPAQGPQNLDFALMFGAARAQPHTFAGGLSTSGAIGFAFLQSAGYQIRRTSIGGLWIDMTPAAIFSPGKSTGSNGQSIHYRTTALTGSIRFMIPLHVRASVFGRFGGGAGAFNKPELMDDPFPSPYLLQKLELHGLLDLGGGVNLRLNTHLSIRGELRDFITRRGLGGVAGRHHVVPLLGVALHF